MIPILNFSNWLCFELAVYLFMSELRAAFYDKMVFVCQESSAPLKRRKTHRHGIHSTSTASYEYCAQ
eukprot:scaffold61324_cov26-Prasinocladus_malaysianus.AAC.2